MILMSLHDKLENSDASVVNMNVWQLSSEDVKYSLCVNTMYSLINLKIFMIIYSEDY
jgi:hypothetical protein